MNIIFVRHGESEYNAGLVKDERKNTKLTQKGEKQAEALGKRLKNYNISEIYTSDSKRAIKTGKIISKIIGVPIKENVEELSEFPSEHLRYRRRRIFDFKTKKRVKKLKKFLDRISLEREEDKTILIVAHGITNKMIMGHLLRVPLNRKLLRFSQDNTCINILNWKPEHNNWNAGCINDIHHLPEKMKSIKKKFEK